MPQQRQKAANRPEAARADHDHEADDRDHEEGDYDQGDYHYDATFGRGYGAREREGRPERRISVRRRVGLRQSTPGFGSARHDAVGHGSEWSTTEPHPAGGR